MELQRMLLILTVAWGFPAGLAGAADPNAASPAYQDSAPLPVTPEKALPEPAPPEPAPLDHVAAATIVVDARRYHVFWMDPARHRLRLFWKDPQGQPYLGFDRLLGAWPHRHPPLALFNGGIYQDLPRADGTVEHRPLGLYVERGRQLVDVNGEAGTGNFFHKPNGVLFQPRSRWWRILETGAYQRWRAQRRQPPRQAVQSGPLLVQGGVIHDGPYFRAASTSEKRRNGVGIDSQGRVVLVVAVDPVNLYQFARLFRDTLACPDALYLDGTLSAADIPALGVRDRVARPFASILAVVPGPESQRPRTGAHRMPWHSSP